jgi:hypothetical protein
MFGKLQIDRGDMFTFLRHPQSLQIIHDICVPVLLPLLIGYDSARGEARYIGVTYADLPGMITVDDGSETYICPADGWAAFHHHARIAPYLTGYDFGFNGEPRHMFIVDRANNAAMVGSIEAAAQFLDDKRSHRIARSGPSWQLRQAVSTQVGALRASDMAAYRSSFQTTVLSLLPDLRLALELGI